MKQFSPSMEKVDSSKKLIPKAVGLQLNPKSEFDENEYGEGAVLREVTSFLKKEKKYEYDELPDRGIKNKMLMRKMLRSLKFFSENPGYDTEVFVENVKLMTYQKDEDIFNTANLSKSNDRYFYIVFYGFVSVFIPQSTVSDDKGLKKYTSQVYQYGKGESFGEDCVIDSFYREIPKNKNVMYRSSGAVEETGLLCLNWDLYKKKLFQQHELKLIKRSQFLRKLNVPLFMKFQDNLLIEFAKALKLQTVLSGKIIYKQNDPGLEMFFVVEGECSIVKNISINGKLKYFHLATLRRGEYFGELAFLKHSHIPLKRNWSVFTTKKTTLLSLDKLCYTTFIEQSKDAVEILKKYSNEYPSEKVIIGIYNKRQNWDHYKKNLLKNIRNEKRKY